MIPSPVHSDPAHAGSFQTFLKTHECVSTPLHKHATYEMNLVMKGEGTRHVAGRKDYFEAGDLVLLGPHIPHNWRQKQSARDGYHSLVIQWDDRLLGGTWQQMPEFAPIRQLLKLSSKGIVFGKHFGNEIKRYQEELLARPSFRRLLLFLNILNDFSASDDYEVLSSENLTQRNAVPNSRMEKVHSFVRENYSEKITLKKVAAVINMSEGAFSRFFSQHADKPFFSFLNEYRIQRSHELLRDTDMRVNEIGFACGYESLQFFYRQFMKYTHCAPQDFRKKIYAE